MAVIFCEAEQFADYGGWLLDSQFAQEMGSAYLLAHGLGKPVADAVTRIEVKESGIYTVWVRVKDWVPKYHPGRFSLIINGTTVGELGRSGIEGWAWEMIAVVPLEHGTAEVRLHDLTGFGGRCDAIYFTTTFDAPPEQGNHVDHRWRKALLGMPDDPKRAGAYDVIVVGGGMAGCSAALAAAKTGSRVALVADRPVLGGNASPEVGLGPRGYMGKFTEQMCAREDCGRMAAHTMLEDEPGVTLLVNEQVFSLGKNEGAIASVDLRNLITGEEKRLEGKIFIDCSGKGILARLAGAEVRTGREGKAEFDEGLAPNEADEKHHGHTVLYHLRDAGHPVTFPEVPWATEVSRDFSNLDGQMGGLGKDNQFGPDAHGGPGAWKRIKMVSALPAFGTSVLSSGRFPEKKVMGVFPGSHFWEYGQNMDLFTESEQIRDHLLCALYGTMYTVKQAQPEKNANLEFAWIHHNLASGEYCRIVGDYILNENDVRAHTEFSDAIVQQDGAFCIHCMENPQYDFRLTSWIWDMRDRKPYWLPFRSLYSKDVSNLLMAGKQISVSRVVGCNTKLMANGAEQGIAVGCAATLCQLKGITPRDICAEHMDQLRKMVAQFE